MKLIAKRYAGFASNGKGGNPAGVVFTQEKLHREDMLDIAKQIGDSETVFATQEADSHFSIRYFAPESEVDFCGHATIALGQALANQFGKSQYQLNTNKGQLILDNTSEKLIRFRSPVTSSRLLKEEELDFVFKNSNLDPSALVKTIPPAMVNAGNDHIFLVLNDLQFLSRFEYDFEAFKPWMQEHQVVTMAVAVMLSDSEIQVRNAFAFGGVYEDPATGAAAAAISGYFRDEQLTQLQQLTFYQGIEMGQPCVLKSSLHDAKGSGVFVGGEAYFLNEVSIK